MIALPWRTYKKNTYKKNPIYLAVLIDFAVRN